MAAIYHPLVEATAASFEEVAPDAAEMEQRIRATVQLTPWLVAADDEGSVAGFAYASRHRPRAAYRWSVDVSASVAEGQRGNGVGRLLYGELLAILTAQGFVNAYAGIALPNPASVALHEAMGMRRIGVYERVGFKLGSWHDVAWYGLRLCEPVGRPHEPIPWPELGAG